MSGTKAGAAKAQKTIIERYGKNANGKSKMHQSAGRIGGLTIHKLPRGFAANRNLASAAGKIGGALSRKTKKA